MIAPVGLLGGGGGRQVMVSQGEGGCKDILRQSVVTSSAASKQNTDGQTSSARMRDWGRFGGLGFLHISSKGLVDLDIVRLCVRLGV